MIHLRPESDPACSQQEHETLTPVHVAETTSTLQVEGGTVLPPLRSTKKHHGKTVVMSGLW